MTVKTEWVDVGDERRLKIAIANESDNVTLYISPETFEDLCRALGGTKEGKNTYRVGLAWWGGGRIVPVMDVSPIKAIERAARLVWSDLESVDRVGSDYVAHLEGGAQREFGASIEVL